MKIEFKNVYFKYNKDDIVLNGVSFVINTNSSYAIIGPNGSGKSTITKLIMGLLKPDKGEIYIDDCLVDDKTFEKVRSKIGIIFQNPDNQFVGVTVKDDIAFGLENRCVEKEKMEEQILKYAKFVKVDHLLNRNPEELSGGQKQRVALAGVLALEPEVLIFDEATSMLDPISVDEVNKSLKMLKKTAKKTIIMITHNLEEILYFDNVILINNGKIQKVGKPIEIIKDSNLLTKNNLAVSDTIKLLNVLKDNKELEDKIWELLLKM